ncbi:MAG TPA: universal stress protein [Gaiellaceae bacterium]
MATVVVGVDGSSSARAALEFAAGEAALHRARLLIVCAWEIPPSIYDWDGVLDQATVDALRESAENEAKDAFDVAKTLQPGLECEARIAEGHAAEVLLGESGGAAMIVVGNRGRGGFASLLLGSVSQQVVSHAFCPVTVVHHSAAGQSEAREGGGS